MSIEKTNYLGGPVAMFMAGAFPSDIADKFGTSQSVAANEIRARITALEDAIKAHRSSFSESGFDDDSLWAVLGETPTALEESK